MCVCIRVCACACRHYFSEEGQHSPLTRSTSYTGVLIVTTIMHPPALEFTLVQVRLVPSTAKVVHPNLSRATSKASIGPGLCGSTVPQLPAYNVSIIDVPVIVTDCAPLSTVVDLNTTFIGVISSSIDKTNCQVCKEITYAVSANIVCHMMALEYKH